MPTPPPPDIPCVRVRMIWNKTAPPEFGSRFYLTYSGSAPTPANCVTLAGDIETAYAAQFLTFCTTGNALEEIDVLDIATTRGASGQWAGVTNGTNAGAVLPNSIAFNCEYDIAERYRGGKPRGYWPFGTETMLATPNTWTSGTITSFNTAIAAFFAAIAALSVGSMGTLGHTYLSYYDGVNKNTPPWRGPGYKYPPLYRSPNAITNPVTGYSLKAIVGSQRRRRTSTTP